MQFLDWDFSRDLSAAIHVESGVEIRFTRSERSLLQALMSYKGRIWARDQLVDAVSGVDALTSDRNIDYVINRVRRKLCDSARDPRYIETRYGEGYVWIAGSSLVKPEGHVALPPVRTRLRGDAVMSYCDRPGAERSVLRRYADRLLVLRLQGSLYYGAANRISGDVQAELDRDLDCLVLDFRDVQGVDESAVPVIADLERLARDSGFDLILSSVRPVIDNRLRPIEARRFGSLDKAVEWRETKILEVDPPAASDSRSLAACLAEEIDCADAATIVRHFEAFDAPPGAEIIRAESETREMFFLERGTAEVDLDVLGTQVRASRIWPGTLFGEIGFHCGGPRTATVRTLEDSHLVRLRRSEFERLEADFPRLALALHRFLARRAAKRLRFYNDMMVDLFRSTLP